MRSLKFCLTGLIATTVLIGCGNAGEPQSDGQPSSNAAQNDRDAPPNGRSTSGEATAGTSGDFGSPGGGPTGYNGKGSTAGAQQTTGMGTTTGGASAGRG